MLSFYLDFEDDIRKLDEELETLNACLAQKPELTQQILTLREARTEKLRQIYSSLTPWQKTLVARHYDRPQSQDLIQTITDEFVELHGDRRYGDDKAVITGLGRINEHRVMFLGHRKGHDAKERAAFNFGCPHPEGYRKALRRMQMAEKFGIPVVCFIDTAGAYPGVEAEERGQHMAIAENLFEMSRLRTPIICIVIGEGGSGGALGLGVGDRVAMFEHAYYSVISPEGCAGILWKDRRYAEQAAEALRFTAQDLLSMSVIDEVIPEPLGGAHRNPLLTAIRLKSYVVRTLVDLASGRMEREDLDLLVEKRYERFRSMGEVSSASPLTSPLSSPINGPALPTGLSVEPEPWPNL